MQAGRTENAVKNTISGLIFRIIGLLLPFVIRTIIIKKLGMDYAGLNSLFASILQVLSLTELGFAATIAYAMYKPIAEGDSKLICALLNFIKKVYYIVGGVILVVGLAITPLLPYFISGTYPADINLYILYFIYLFNTVISYFIFAYKGILLTAHQLNRVENNIMTVATIAMYALQILVLILFANYYVYIIFLPLMTISINIVRSIMVDKMFPEYKCVGNLPKEEKKAIYKNIGALIGHRLSNIVIIAIINIIISAQLGLYELGVYGNYYYIVSALISIITVFYTAITASIGNNMVECDVDSNYRNFNVLTFVNVWMVGWISITLMCLCQHFMLIWQGEENMFSTLTVILFVAMFYLWKFKDIVSTYKDAAGMWRADIAKPYVVVAVTLILSLVLIRFWGVNGTLVAIIAGAFVVSMPWETRVLFKNYFKKSTGNYYLKMLIYTIAILLVGGLTYYVCSLLPANGYLWLFVKLAICCVLPNLLILLLSFKTKEFKLLLQKIKNMFARKRKIEQN